VQLIQTPKGPLVLLFYDGFEWRARTGKIDRAKAQARRLARYLYRSARRKQVFTGFYTAFLALRKSLEREGYDVRVNDFAAARAHPDYPIGIAGYPSVLDAVRLPNPMIFGPGDFGGTREAAQVAAREQMRFLIQPSDWARDYYRASCGDKAVTWFAGIDTEAWPDSASKSKSVDVLIYDKIRWHRDREVPAILDRLTAHLDARGRSWKVLRYGAHHRNEFADWLKEARSFAFLCEHETQGLACQEAMSTNVPIFAWDEGVFVDPALNRDAEQSLQVSSVPYFDSRCGLRFRRDDLEDAFDRFWDHLPTYHPRDFVKDELSMSASARAYLELYRRAGSRT